MKRIAAVLIPLAACIVAASTIAPVPIQGNPKSSIRVIIYEDLECPGCAQLHNALRDQLLPEFETRVGFELRDFPLPMHPWAYNAAVLARFFDSRQLKVGLDWRDYCFTHQEIITPGNLLDVATSWAAKYGIPRQQIDEGFSNADLYGLIKTDQERGTRDGVAHTPTVLLGGVEVGDAKTTIDQLVVKLRQQLTQTLAAAH